MSDNENVLTSGSTAQFGAPSAPATTALGSENTANEKNEAKKKKAKEDALANVQILNEPNRKLPKIIEELLQKDVPVVLAKNGYYVGGFYGLNQEIGKAGFAFAQETSEFDTLVFVDNKNHKHLVKSFEDLVKFNNHVWSIYFKLSEDYRKPDTLWFGYMLQYGVLSITPGR